MSAPKSLSGGQKLRDVAVAMDASAWGIASGLPSSARTPRLSHLKCPTSVESRDALPRTATGKLQKFKLRAP
jgi:acyl-CoA synthetase (AMP-forming)/AMP-acid ligase II